jgi:succinyl-diaminopimelate desuccinylase
MTEPISTDPVSLATALIRCPSVTPEEGGALVLVERTLREAGFVTRWDIFGQETGTPVTNLVARYGTRKPVLILAGHSDVVPPGPEAAWRHPPFAGIIENGFLYGRGAVDMKGGLACLVAAALRFVKQNPDFDGSILCFVTGDEEGPALHGTAKVLEAMAQRGEPFDYCLLAEPTCPDRLGTTLKIGRRGSLTGDLIVNGVQGHVAYPERAQNPIPILLRLLRVLLDENLDQVQVGRSTLFDPSHLEITTIDVGNPTPNVIPEQAKATFNIRFNDLWTAQSLAAHLHQRLKSACPENPYTLTFRHSNAPAFVTEPDAFTALVSDAITAETGEVPALSTSGGTSDARFFSQYGKVLEFGLVGQTMHQIDECVAIADLEALTRIFEDVLARYFLKEEKSSLSFKAHGNTHATANAEGG